MANKQAILIGINEYPKGSGLAPLLLAEADARKLAGQLEGVCGFKTTLLLGAQATRDALEEAMESKARGELT